MKKLLFIAFILLSACSKDETSMGHIHVMQFTMENGDVPDHLTVTINTETGIVKFSQRGYAFRMISATSDFTFGSIHDDIKNIFTFNADDAGLTRSLLGTQKVIMYYPGFPYSLVKIYNIK